MPRAQTRNALVEQVLQEVANAELAAPAIPLEQEGFRPVRVWTAGPGSPQEKLVVPGTVYGVKPQGDGSYVLRSPEMVDLAKKALGSRYWPDDIPDDAASMNCDQCGWRTRSYRAFQAHVNNVHPRPQSVR